MSLRAGAALLAFAVVAGACAAEEPAADPTPTPAPQESTPDDIDVDLGGDEALARFYGQQPSWEPCEESECATVEVPLDYDDPDGQVIELAVLRSPAAGDDRIGSLLVNPGGPGGSGVEYAAQASAILTDAVRERFDIVGFDPRGVASSTPIDCLTDAELDEFVAAEASPSDAEGVTDLEGQLEAFADGCEARSAALLPHVGTPDVARDLDVLRAVLGDERLHYLGKSYGTFIGAWYAELFPDRVGRLVLDGAIDPAVSGQEMALGQARGFELALSAFLTYCVGLDECPLGRTEAEAYDTVRDLLEVIADSPLPTADEDRPLTESLAILGIALPLYLAPDQGYDPLVGALDEALGGRGSNLAIFADLYLRRNPDGTYVGNQNEAIYAVNCLDRPEAASVEDVNDAMAEFEEASEIFGPFLAWGGLACSDWPAAADVEPGPLTAPGAAPILVVGTTGDPATPYEWAQALAAQLESGVLLTYEGAGHTAYFSGSGCVDDTVDAYLLDGIVPADGLRCD